MAQSINSPVSARQLLSKVPEITLWFWIIKVLATTVGETFADYLNVTLGWGLSKTTYVMGALLILALVAQFIVRRYIPVVYWLAVVLLSVVGTLITDNLTDSQGVPLPTTTIIFAAALIAVFVIWWLSERTLSIHSIVTRRREAFYWLAILFTFALGTAAGDLISERLALGYFPTLLVFVGAIAVVAVLHYGLKVNAVLTFWLAYILTRPLGASIGDWLSQPTEDSGLGLGTTVTSFIFLGVIVLVLAYLTITRKDLEVVELGTDGEPVEHERVAWPGDHQ
ncbi:MAG: hypothetical protein WCN97_10055 [Thermoleophilia bacterium]